MLKRYELILLIAVFVFTLTLQALAAEEEHEEHKESHYHRNHVGLFLGSTHEEGEHKFTIGLDYEYRFSQYFGIGLLGEYVGEPDREGVGLVPLFLHPYKGLRFMAAPGVKPKKDEDKFIWRLGVAYRFPIGNWTIAPEFNVDFSEGETYHTLITYDRGTSLNSSIFPYRIIDPDEIFQVT
jgi:hypothetical protein